MSKKLIGIIASLALVLSMVGASTASALTAGDISMLQAAGIISAAQAATLNASLTPSATVSSGYTFAKDLKVGSKGADVTALQNLLGIKPATGYFGSLTKAAVIKFQLSKNITPAAGYFGAKSRAVANASAGSVSTGTTTTGGVVSTGVTGTDLSVSLSPTSPLASALIAGQAAADLAEFTFANRSAAPAVVTNVTLQRMGVSGDTSMANVYLYNGAVRLTDSASVSSGKITFNAAGGIFTVPAGSSIVISVRSDIDSSANGQLLAVALTGVTASIPVSAVYPVSGSSMSVFTSSDIAKATSTLVQGTINGGSITAGSLNQTIWSSSLNLAGRAVYLKSLALKVIGSVPSNSLQNVKLFAAGIQVASATGMDANGMITFDLSAAPYKMDSSRTLEVRADVVNGSSRSFNVQLQNASDLMLIDSNYNVGITVAFVGTQSSGSWAVSTGSVTTQLDSSLAAGDVVTGASGVALARYTMKAYGEDMKITYLQASSSIAMDNVALYANGVQIGSTKTFTTANVANLFSIGSSLVIPAGQTVTLEIRGDIKYNGVNASTTANQNFKVALIGYSGNAQGSYSSQLSTVPATSIEGPSMRVVGAGLTVAANGTMSNSAAVPSTTNVRLGSYVLQANSSEAIRITNLTVALGGTISATTSLSNLYVSIDGVKTNPVNPQGSNNFSVDFTVPASASKIVDVYADIANVSAVNASTSLSVNGYGVGSNITVSSVAKVGQLISVGAGALSTPSLDISASPVAQLVIGGSTSLLANFSANSTNGASTISEMYFDVAGPITNITVGGISFPVISGSSTATGLNIVIPTGYAGTDIPVTATYAVIGQNGQASLQIASTTLTGYKFTSGNNTVSTTTLSTSKASRSSYPMVVVASKPTVTVSNPVNYTNVGTGNVIIARVTVTPDVAGPIGLMKLPLTITTSVGATTTATTTVVKVGNTVIATTANLGVPAVGSGSSQTGSIVFTGTDGYQISGATTFDIYSDVVMSSDTNLAPRISTALDVPANFVWSDINGGGAALNATTTGDIFNYPTNSATINY